MNVIYFMEVKDLMNSLKIKSETINFPKNILNMLNNKVSDPVSFSIVCIASHFEPNLFFY